MGVRSAIVRSLLVLCTLHPLGEHRGKFGRDGVVNTVINIVGVMALRTEPPPLLTILVPLPDPLSVYPPSPVMEYRAMTFAAEELGLVEAYLLIPVVYEDIPVPGTMAVEAPHPAVAVL